MEVGRWKRRGRGRLPLEERLGSCGQVQTEAHVIYLCRFSQHIRDTHGFSTLHDVFNGAFGKATLCSVTSSSLGLYSQKLEITLNVTCVI